MDDRAFASIVVDIVSKLCVFTAEQQGVDVDDVTRHTCPRQCNDRGYCVNGMCNCDQGTCSIVTCVVLYCIALHCIALHCITYITLLCIVM